jgi:hypothetical protein
MLVELFFRTEPLTNDSTIRQALHRRLFREDEGNRRGRKSMDGSKAATPLADATVALVALQDPPTCRCRR